MSSNEDINSTAVYPTAPYSLKIPFKNVTFLPDPCIIKLNGVTIGMTATDIYNHIIEAEIAVYVSIEHFFFLTVSSLQLISNLKNIRSEMLVIE